MHQVARDRTAGKSESGSGAGSISLSPELEDDGRSAALDRVLRALNHPVRRRILRELGRKPASASSLAQSFEAETGLVSYHLNQVLAQECGVVELVDTVARRGALEKIYALNPEIWEVLQTSLGLAEDGCEFRPLEVDGMAMEEIIAAQRDFRDRISVAVEASQARCSQPGQVTHRLVLGMATFAAIGEGHVSVSAALSP